jgi:hypothetical protein
MNVNTSVELIPNRARDMDIMISPEVWLLAGNLISIVASL